jgi:exosome complex RNA-binding protein Rrp42 (RNase PH superfamily)
MGETTMVCGIKAEIAEPDSARPNEGFISELHGLTEQGTADASPKYRSTSTLFTQIQTGAAGRRSSSIFESAI